jgi:putative SOS response-associated peptidase YedK
MCGRYTLKTKDKKLASHFNAGLSEPFGPHYNIAPTFNVPVVLVDPSTNERVIKSNYWGLIPDWAKNPTMAYDTYNAKAETITENAFYKRAFKEKRCLVMMDGFFEWDRSAQPHQPYYICMKNEEPFAARAFMNPGKFGGKKTRGTPKDREKMGRSLSQFPGPSRWGGRNTNRATF